MQPPNPLSNASASRARGRGACRLAAQYLFGTLVLWGLLTSCGADGDDAAGSTDGADSSNIDSSSTSTRTSASTAAPTTLASVTTAASSSTEPSATPTSAESTVPSSAESSTEPSVTSTTTVAAPVGTETTSVPFDGALGGPVDAAEQTVFLRFESKIADVSAEQLASEVLAVLNDERGWPRAGFRFASDEASPFRVVLAEGTEVNALCLPLRTYGTVSCQNGPVVALNADRWRGAVPHWDAEVSDYRGYLINHEVGHLLGQRHPKPRCPVAGRPAGVMEQQTAGLEGCTGNAWPRDWEIALAAERPVVYAPLPDWGPDPVPANGES